MRLLNLFRKKNSLYEPPQLQELKERISLLPIPAIQTELLSQLSRIEKAYRKYIKTLEDRPGTIQEKAIMLYQSFYLMILKKSVGIHNQKIDLLSENSDTQKKRRNKILLSMATLSLHMSYRCIYLLEKLYHTCQRKVFYETYAELYKKIYIISYLNLKEKIEEAEKN